MANSLSEPRRRKEPSPVETQEKAWEVEEGSAGGGCGAICTLKDAEFAFNTGGTRGIPSRGPSNEQGHSSIKLLLGAGTSDKRCLFQARTHIMYFPGGGLTMGLKH